MKAGINATNKKHLFNEGRDQETNKKRLDNEDRDQCNQ